MAKKEGLTLACHKVARLADAVAALNEAEAEDSTTCEAARLLKQEACIVEELACAEE